MAPDFLKRYLVAKRAVESKLLGSENLRPVIVRPSLIYSMDRPASYLPVGAFFVGNKIGLPFVDRPVTVQTLASAMVQSIATPTVRGILRYPQIDEIGASKYRAALFRTRAFRSLRGREDFKTLARTVGRLESREQARRAQKSPQLEKGGAK